MICPHCHAELTRNNARGEPVIRNRGIVMKSDGLALVCPKCKGDVPPSPEAMQLLHRYAVLFFRPPPS